MKQPMFLVFAVITKRIDESYRTLQAYVRKISPGVEMTGCRDDKQLCHFEQSFAIPNAAFVIPSKNMSFRPTGGVLKANQLNNNISPPLTLMITLHRKSQAQGFSYVEVLVASTLIAIALVPAINALQTGILSAGIHQSLTNQHYQRLKKMEEINAEPFANLLAAAKIAANKTIATSYSDAIGANDRRLIYIALYDADADPFTLTDPNADGDNDLYTGSTANLIWIRVETEGTAQGIETLVSR